ASGWRTSCPAGAACWHSRYAGSRRTRAVRPESCASGLEGSSVSLDRSILGGGVCRSYGGGSLTPLSGTPAGLGCSEPGGVLGGRHRATKIAKQHPDKLT